MGKQSRLRRERIVAGLEEPIGMTDEQKAGKRELKQYCHDMSSLTAKNPMLGFALVGSMLKSVKKLDSLGM